MHLDLPHTHMVSAHNINAPTAFPEEQPPAYQGSQRSRDAAQDDQTVERASPGQLILCFHAFTLAAAQGVVKGDFSCFMQDAASNAEAVTPLGGVMGAAGKAANVPAQDACASAFTVRVANRESQREP